jgi:ATP-dependent Clp protease ATP-binding subunit ClpA
MYERFTDRARKVMQLANQEAQRFNHEYIGTEHILLGLIKEGSGVAANVLKNLDIDLRKIRTELEKIVRSGPHTVTLGKLPQTPRAKKVIEYAIKEARNLGHNYVGTEHLLLGLLREPEHVAAQVLMNLGLKLEDVHEEVLNLLGHSHSTPPAEKLPPAPPPPLQRVARRVGLWGRRHDEVLIFAGGFLTTLLGGVVGAGCCELDVNAGALLAGAVFVGTVASTCWAVRGPVQPGR